jgi:DNA-binding GntR family transcriptional regulator
LLKTLLVDHRFRPGEQLLIGKLAEYLEVSATPVRETLVRLQAEQLLDSPSRRGFFAKTLNLREMAELYELRFVLLKYAIETNLPFVDENAINTIVTKTAMIADPKVAANSPGRSAEKLQDQVRRLEQIYERLVSLSGRESMIDIIRNVNDRTHYVLMIDLEAPERRNDALCMLDEILLALQRRDVAGTVATLRRDLNASLEIMPMLIKEGINRTHTSLKAGNKTKQWEWCANAGTDAT